MYVGVLEVPKPTPDAITYVSTCKWRRGITEGCDNYYASTINPSGMKLRDTAPILSGDFAVMHRAWNLRCTEEDRAPNLSHL